MTRIVDPPCAQTDPELFFAQSSGEDERAPHIKQAMTICAGCPFKAECARAGLDAVVDEVWVQGVWAGVFVPSVGGIRRRESLQRLEVLAGVTVRELREVRRLEELARLQRLEARGLASWGDVYRMKVAAA
ncbi:WhiB family transcriptional regulator [Rhodococcus jostii]|uniref:WhiB family transcriptional regulator n=1 Tax=Rhodococcus jostii TaxID=132919 RepID=UPI003635CC04